MKNGHDGQNVPEKVGYTRYYEHDGMLRAYANRSMVLAMVFGAIGLSSFAFAVYVRLQPPTVIRVDSEGEAAIVGGTPVPGHTRGLSFVASAADAAPTDVEAKAVVRRFLDHYLNYTPATVDRQMSRRKKSGGAQPPSTANPGSFEHTVCCKRSPALTAIRSPPPVARPSPRS